MDNTHGSYRKAVTDFWSWFITSEDDIVDQCFGEKRLSSDKIISIFSEQINQVIPELAFEIGGDFEITFTPEGNRDYFFLTKYLVENSPRNLKNNWRFFPYRNALNSSTFEMQMANKAIGFEDIEIQANFDSENKLFHITFYEKELSSLDDKSAISMFFIMLDNSIGENYTTIYIDEIIKSKKPLRKKLLKRESPVLLSELKEYMEQTLRKHGCNVYEDICQLVSAYEMEPKESVKPRDDIFFAFTNLISLANDFYSEVDETFQSFSSCGVKPVFISFTCDLKPEDAAKKRSEIAEDIVKEIFSEETFGAPIGLLIGEAVGCQQYYIDLLLFDEDEFIKYATPFFKKYPYDFYLNDYNVKYVNTRKI